jgi:hypothetical protein
MPSSSFVTVRRGEVYHILAPPDLFTELLPEKIGDIALIVHHQGADRHAALAG